ncbi:MAG TPA: pirin family protein, partial [Stellaceae bacterium]|nr:pirin family protein [Stellaceae bacterium]
QVVKLSQGEPTSDGAGVKLNRVIGNRSLGELDPFLLLDEFRSEDGADYIGGFPDHPHRGFETVTYMLAGRMRHGDNKGHSGLLRPGSVQWMTAGRGIVHSEMPEQEDGLMWGFQLWVNLPAADKMTAPRYQEFEPEQVPVAELPGGVKVRVIAGKVGNVVGPVNGIATAPTYLDVELPAGTAASFELPPGQHAFAYPFEGEAAIGDRVVPRGTLAVLGEGTRVALAAKTEPARVLVVAGQPLKEAVVRWGPFVMNTQEQIRAAIADYQAGRF